MSDLTAIEKRKLEGAMGMSSGYVLNFSNGSFAEFVLDSTGLDIFDSKYDYGSGSKANRLRAFWKIEGNYVVGKLMGDIIEAWTELIGCGSPPHPPEDCVKIVNRLKRGAPVPDIDAVVPNAVEQGFESLAKSVREAIDRNEPENGLDRLHTFLVKYFRVLCSKRGITTEGEKPLHSLIGEYIKALKSEGLIESEMTERILKSAISIMEAFNKVRNDQSYAHDNKVLSYNESLLIFGHVTSSIRFIEAIEKNRAAASQSEGENA